LRLREGDLTYAQLQAQVNRAGNVFRAAGIGPEQRVAILLPDGAEFVAAFIGAMKIGAVPVPINTEAQPADLAFMLHDCRARALVAHTNHLSAATALEATLFRVGDTGTGCDFRAALERASAE